MQPDWRAVGTEGSACRVRGGHSPAPGWPNSSIFDLQRERKGFWVRIRARIASFVGSAPGAEEPAAAPTADLHYLARSGFALAQSRPALRVTKGIRRPDSIPRLGLRRLKG